MPSGRAELFVRIAELEAEVARLREALERYGRHSDFCLDPCDCGYAEALVPVTGTTGDKPAAGPGGEAK